MKKVLHSDNGVTSTFHYDEMADRSIIQTSQDCEPIIERNKAVQSEKNDIGDWARHVATIPLVVAQKWMQDDGVNFLAMGKADRRKYLRRKLNDPEWRYLRTGQGTF